MVIHDLDLNTVAYERFCHQYSVINHLSPSCHKSASFHLINLLKQIFRLIKINGSFIFILAVITWSVLNVSCTDQIQMIQNLEIGDWSKVNVQFVIIGQKSFVDRIIKWILLKRRKKKLEKLLIFLIGKAENFTLTVLLPKNY